MPERTTFAPPHPTAATTERGESPMVERIWQTNDLIVSQRYKQAEQALLDRHQQAPPEHAVAVAYNIQRKALKQANTENWTTSQFTANHLTLVMLGLPNAARAQTALDKDLLEGQQRKDAKGVMSNFNNDLSETLTYAPSQMLSSLEENIVNRSNKTLRGRWQLPTMEQKDIKRVISGIAREVQIRRALLGEMPEGWSMEGSDTEEDLRRIDLKVTNKEGRQQCFDIKSKAAFNALLDKLEKNRVFDRQQIDRFYKQGYFYDKTTDAQGNQVETCVFDADQFDKKDKFEYEDTLAVFEFIEDRINEGKARSLRKMGKSAIIN